MIADSAILLPSLTRPRSFAGLMTLYESNYVRLSWLMPESRGLEQLQGELVSRVPGDCALYLSVREVCRYTTTVHMTYFFEESGELVADPDLRIRIYHDARLAEAMACGPTHHRHPALSSFDTARGAELRRRWTRNIMLNKWLEYCSDRQHCFRSRAPHPPTSLPAL